jgi:CubicO group peptidase (beta-lactamase class C family)
VLHVSGVVEEVVKKNKKRKKEKKKRKKKKGMRLLGFLVVLVVAVAVIFQSQLVRLHKVATLFHEGKIAENFRATTEWGMPHRKMRRGSSPVAHFNEQQKHETLPSHFTTVEGLKLDMALWLHNHSTTGFVVMKRSEVQKATILYEQYWNGNDRNSKAISWSMGKSLVSAAFGIAVEQGHIGDIEKDTVCQYLPKLKGTGYENVTLKNVLQMSSGVEFDENYFSITSDINMMGYWLALGLNIDSFVARLQQGTRQQGTYNHYVSMDTQVLGMVVAAATKKTLSAFIEEEIWAKAGFEADGSWLLDNEENGIELSFGTVGATTRDYCRFGWLYLNQGHSPATGEPVVPKKWVQASVTPDQPHLMPDAFDKKLSNSKYFGYGYQWWVAPREDDPSKPSENYLAIGVYNQFIGVFPEHNVVIAKNSAWAGYNGETIMQSETETYKAFLAIAEQFSSKTK